MFTKNAILKSKGLTSSVFLLLNCISAGKCPVMHNATEVNNNELVTCACDYQEGTGKKDTTLESGIENKNLCSCLSNL